uniref:OCA domain-containing protein n=1 Tax=Acanthochromis polyacanthus TaxID=80966 RepID=A0A3Q1FXA2_9TELE
WAMGGSLTSPAAVGRSRPYQGVRVRDPVKELLRRKRSLELHSNKTPPLTAHVTKTQAFLCYSGIFGSDVASGSAAEPSAAAGDGGLQCSGWKAAPSVSSAGLQPAVMPWSSSDYNQQDPSAQTLAYPATPTLTADVYMQTLCPSYTMLTYTHTPLLTNFGVSETRSSLPGSPLVHMPLSMSLTTMFPQLETQGADPQPQILELPQHSDHQLDPEPQGQSLNEDPEVESESPNLLDKLLEDHKEPGEEEETDSYRSSIFIPSV